MPSTTQTRPQEKDSVEKVNNYIKNQKKKLFNGEGNPMGEVWAIIGRIGRLNESNEEGAKQLFDTLLEILPEQKNDESLCIIEAKIIELSKSHPAHNDSKYPDESSFPEEFKQTCLYKIGKKSIGVESLKNPEHQSRLTEHTKTTDKEVLKQLENLSKYAIEEKDEKLKLLLRAPKRLRELSDQKTKTTLYQDDYTDYLKELLSMMSRRQKYDEDFLRTQAQEQERKTDSLPPVSGARITDKRQPQQPEGGPTSTGGRRGINIRRKPSASPTQPSMKVRQIIPIK